VGSGSIRGGAIRASEVETRLELARKLPQELERNLPVALAALLPMLVKRELQSMVPAAVARQMHRLEDAVFQSLTDELVVQGLLEKNGFEWGELIDPEPETNREPASDPNSTT
jgi:hypothetical protein